MKWNTENLIKYNWNAYKTLYITAYSLRTRTSTNFDHILIAHQIKIIKIMQIRIRRKMEQSSPQK